jgi:glyoxylase-like metal-dependent hydrolase (beta-lactamase superfamily II)
MSTTVRLHPLRTGELLAPAQLLTRMPGPFATPKALGIGVPKSQRVWIPVPAFLLEHPDQGPVLIDTGMPSAAATDFAGALGRTAARLYEVRMTAQDGTAAQVRARGVDPDAIRQVFMTHLHIDHASGMPEFPGATFAASTTEWRLADRSAIPRLLNGYHRPHYEGRARRELSFADGSPWQGFERTIDVFGDGSLRAIFTPGHTVGHVSYAVATDAGTVLLTGDLAYTLAGVHGSSEPGLRASPKLLKLSLAQLHRHVREHPDTIVIPGHDPDAWAGLAAAY